MYARFRCSAEEQTLILFLSIEQKCEILIFQFYFGKLSKARFVFFNKSKANLLEEGQLFLGLSAGAIQNSFGWQAINIGVLPLRAIISLGLLSANRQLLD